MTASDQLLILMAQRVELLRWLRALHKRAVSNHRRLSMNSRVDSEITTEMQKAVEALASSIKTLEDLEVKYDISGRWRDYNLSNEPSYLKDTRKAP